VLSPVEGVALKAVARNAGKARMKSGEGEGEPEGEAEGEGEANPFDLLDLESDFVVFLDGFFEEYTPGQETTADLNAISVQTTGSFREILPAPNGIPDLAELLLLQRFLQDETLDFSLSGGPSHEDAADRWEYFETLYGPVADPTLAPVYRVGLAYSCLDDFMSMYLGAALLSIATEVELDGMNVLAALQTTTYAFCQSADVDGDDYSTLLEWQHYGTGQTFAAAYTAFEAAALNPAVYPASVDLYTVTRTCGQNILLFYPPVEKVADGMTLSDYAVFGYDPAQFTQEPFFDHWVITGESALSPRYSGADQIEVLVEDDVTIEHTVLAPDLSTSITFPDAALEAAVRTAIGKPTGTLVLGDVYDPEFTELSATNTGIVSLDGLQHCRYLTSLNLSRNAVETLTPLSTLYRLTALDLGCNVIDDVTPLANLHDLAHLELGIMFLSYLFNPTLVNNNRPEDLAPLVSLKSLEYLGLTDTGLEEEALAPLAALDTLLALSIGKSPGVDVSPVASMDDLLLLIDHDSGLTDTDLNALSTVSGLMSVFLYNNDLDDLDALANCTNMQEVYVHNNPGFSEVPDTFPSMTVFGADECALTDIAPLGDLSVVQQLSLSDNDINDITPLLDIATFEEGASVNILDNPLVHVDTCSTIIALRARGVDVEENAGQCRRTLTYTAGPHGSIQGTSPQSIFLGNDGAPVQAVPATGHYFFQWSDTRTDNPRTDTNVTENITVTAQFLPYQYPLVYLAGAHGAIDGPTPQIVDYGEDGLPVTAVPDYGYHFTDWDDGRIDNPRIDTANTEPLTLTAAFDINQYDLFYGAESHGHISGEPIQLVNHGECGSPVEAVPDIGYHFVQWSDGLYDPFRTDCSNTEVLSVAASFSGNIYTLAFDAKGGSDPVPTTKQVAFGELYGTLPSPVRPGYFFDGWWTSVVEGSHVLSSTRMLKAGDHTLYARWAPHVVSVYFDSRDGSTSVPQLKLVTFGEAYGTLATTSRFGYFFDGWWTHPVSGVEITAESLMTDTNLHMILYAHWSPMTCSLTYLAQQNGSIDGDAEQQVVYGACGTPVTAVPNTGYHFLLWDDDVVDNPRIDCYNTEPLTVTAGFAVNQYTLTYTSGNNGALDGPTQQQVNHGEDGSAVTPIPNNGCSFLQWSDGSTANPRTDTNVTGNISVTALFSVPAQYTLHYSAGSGGTLQGQTEQSVPGGGSGSAVIAVPNTGYHFLQWSDASTNNSRTDANVQAHLSVTALFAANQYTLNYASEANGCILGPITQYISHGTNGSYILASPDEGYRFTSWSDNWTNPDGNHLNALRRDVNVISNINAQALFAPLSYVLTYVAGDNGSILGVSQQTVNYGQSGAAVRAVSEPGYTFVNWSDGRTDNPRTDLSVRSDISVSATFASIINENFSLPMYLQSWMDFLRDTSSPNPLDTLAWFRDDASSMYDYMLSINWGSSYNFAALWIYAALLQENTPLTIDCIGAFNLNLETESAAIPDMVEYYVIERILKDTTHPLHSSVMSAFISNVTKWGDYHHNLEDSVTGFVTPSDPILLALSAYSTLDSITSGIAANFYAIHLSRLYNSPVQKPPTGFSVIPELAQASDLDADGFTNLEEFYFVDHMLGFPLLNFCNGSKDNQGMTGNLDIYADYILDDKKKPGGQTPVVPGEPWPSCVCSEPTFTIDKKFDPGTDHMYFSPEDYGLILLEPQKDRYRLGEKVKVIYVPSDESVFLEWDAVPRSHIASFSKDPETSIYVTGDTTITAIIRQKSPFFLNIQNLTPEHGEIVWDYGPHEYGDVVVPTAIPEPGYVCDWKTHDYYKARLHNVSSPSIYMDSTKTLQVVFRKSDGIYGGYSATVDIVGGTGKILASNGYCCCTFNGDVYGDCGAWGPYLSNAVSGGQYVSAKCLPDPEFFFTYWKMNNGYMDYYTLGSGIDSMPLVGPSHFTAYLTPAVSLDVQVEGQGVVTSDDFRCSYPKEVYRTNDWPIGTSITEQVDANRVRMTHHACSEWNFERWEVQDDQGAQTTVLNGQGQPETGDLIINVNKNSTVKAVFLPQPESLAIVSGTQFTYHENICAIAANVLPSNGNYTWSLTPINGADLTTISNTPNQSDVVLKYTNLPCNNEEFGSKELAVTKVCNGRAASKSIKVFFEATGTDHPPIPANEASDYYSHTPWTHSAVLPNWFYYWRQTSAGNVQPTPLYHHTVSCAGWDDGKKQWCVRIGQEASSDYSNLIGSDNNLTLNVNKGPIAWVSTGIDTFAWVCRHEASHVGWYKQWYPGGDSQISACSADGDTIDDIWELSSGYNTSVQDSNNDSIKDCEDLTIRTQSLWNEYAAKYEDWANPGQQYDPTN